MYRRMGRRLAVTLGLVLGATVLSAPSASANTIIDSSTRSYQGSTLRVNLVSNDAGSIRAECSIRYGSVRRRIRACNVLSRGFSQLTYTANIDPNWPTWTTGLAAAQSSWYRYSCGSYYWVAMLYDMGYSYNREMYADTSVRVC